MLSAVSGRTSLFWSWKFVFLSCLCLYLCISYVRICVFYCYCICVVGVLIWDIERGQCAKMVSHVWSQSSSLFVCVHLWICLCEFVIFFCNCINYTFVLFVRYWRKPSPAVWWAALSGLDELLHCWWKFITFLTMNILSNRALCSGTFSVLLMNILFWIMSLQHTETVSGLGLRMSGSSGQTEYATNL